MTSGPIKVDEEGKPWDAGDKELTQTSRDRDRARGNEPRGRFAGPGVCACTVPWKLRSHAASLVTNTRTETKRMLLATNQTGSKRRLLTREWEGREEAVIGTAPVQADQR